MASNISWRWPPKTYELIASVRRASFDLSMADVTTSIREREHVERMLKRAQRHQARAEKLVVKWQSKLASLDRAGLAAVQPRLWPEESDPVTSPTSLHADS